MVLDEKSAVEAQRLGLDIVFDELAEALAAVGIGAAAPGLGTAEESKSHLNLPSVSAAMTRTGARRGAHLRPNWRASPTQCVDQPRPGPPKYRSRNRSRR